MQNLPISPSVASVAPSQIAPSQAAAGAPESAPAAPAEGDFNTVLARQLAAETGSAAAANESRIAPVVLGGSAPVVADIIKGTDKNEPPAVDGVNAAAQSGMMALMAASIVPVELKPVVTPTTSEALSGTSNSGTPTLLGQLQANESKNIAGGAVVGQLVASGDNASNVSGTQGMKFSATLQALVDTHTPVLGAVTPGQQQTSASPDPAKDAQLIAQSQILNPGANPQMATVNVSQNLTLNTPVGSNRWNEDLGQKITWMASRSEQSAELHLNPPDLGPLNVVLHVSGDQATALVTSPHAEVRDAVQQALPKLREMLADNGIMLGNASVSDQGHQGAQNGFSGGGKSSPSFSGNAIEISSVQQGTKMVSTLQSQGIVDTFA